MIKIYFAIAFLFILAATAAYAQDVVFSDDYAVEVSFTAFGGSNNILTIDAADARPGYAGTKSLKVADPGAGYTGGAMVDASNHNATPLSALSFWVKASKVVTFNVSGSGNNAGSSNFASELKDPIAINTDWKRVIIQVPDPAKLTAFNGLWNFSEGADEDAYTNWFDDIQYESIGGGTIGAPTMASMNSQILNLVIEGVPSLRRMLGLLSRLMWSDKTVM